MPERPAVITHGGPKGPGERRASSPLAPVLKIVATTASTLVVEVDAQTRRGLAELVGDSFRVGLRRKRVALRELQVRPRQEANRTGIRNLPGHCRLEGEAGGRPQLLAAPEMDEQR
jgi:hypothetical protein